MDVDGNESISRKVIELTLEFNVTQALFAKFGWDEFFDRFNGYNDEVTLKFY